MNKKVKTAIGCYFLLLDFESRGQPRYGIPYQFLIIDFEYEMIIKPTKAMLDKYATDSFIIELGAIPDNHDIRVEFSYFMELRKVKDENEFETHRNYFQ